jgi:hypothetical protein
MGGRKPHGTVLVYKGRRYTWNIKGYWRCTTMGDRHNLTRRIWEEAHGPIPSGHKVIYLDGDRYNVRLSNLLCLSHSDVQRRRLTDPKYRDLVSCIGIYGQLKRHIMDNLDPSRRPESSRKAWITRRLRYGPSGGNA